MSELHESEEPEVQSGALDLWSQDFNDNYWSRVDALHADEAACPVAVPAGVKAGLDGPPKWWLLNGYKQTKQALTDWETFSTTSGATMLAGEHRFIPLETDPPRHRGFRSFLNPFLSSGALEARVPLIQETARGLLASLQGQGSIAVINDYVRPLSLEATFTALLGLTRDEIDLVRWQTLALDALFSHDPETSGGAFAELQGLQAELLERKRKEEPTGDLVSSLAHHPVGNPTVETEDDLVNVMMSLTLGGLESTGTVLTGTIHHLSTHPQDLLDLRNDSELLAPAIQEALRLYGGVTAHKRRVMKAPDMENAAGISPNDDVVINFNAANRDPREFEDPHTWNPRRTSNRHLAFGVGVHRCIGSNFARLLLTTGLEEFITQFPDFIFDTASGEPTWHTMPDRTISDFRVRPISAG